jgi:hypothetical protein
MADAYPSQLYVRTAASLGRPAESTGRQPAVHMPATNWL